ncbi:hypothetical protein [Flavobacterium sp.]|uniref:hypothetical protein n=1 Tax=Flavobacterium sp. TaxID=239 RepID=UPI00262B91AD|nr:hypothetical protein [Flavobacterium sp.]
MNTITLFDSEPSEKHPNDSLVLSPENQVFRLYHQMNQSLKCISELYEKKMRMFVPGFFPSEEMSEWEIVKALLQVMLDVHYKDIASVHEKPALHYAVSLLAEYDETLFELSSLKHQINNKEVSVDQIDFDRYRAAFNHCFSPEAKQKRMLQRQIHHIQMVFGLTSADVKRTAKHTILRADGYVEVYERHGSLKSPLKDSLTTLCQVFSDAGLNEIANDLNSLVRSLSNLRFRHIQLPYSNEAGHSTLNIYLNGNVELRIPHQAANALQKYIAKGLA